MAKILIVNIKKRGTIDPEDISKIKESNESDKIGKNNEKGFVEDETGSDLDVRVRNWMIRKKILESEDEENNYYSLGG